MVFFLLSNDGSLGWWLGLVSCLQRAYQVECTFRGRAYVSNARQVKLSLIGINRYVDYVPAYPYILKGGLLSITSNVGAYAS